jgi:lysophospholipase L1-like esterase
MKRKVIIRYLVSAVTLLLVIIILAGLWMSREYRKFESNDPIVWKKEIHRFEKLDSKQTYPQNAVLFVGSSSIRFWNSLEGDMAPIPVIQRGFGGSKIGDIVYWAPEIILKYRTRKVVVFAGTNDFTGHANDSPPERVADNVMALVRHIHDAQPETRIYYISITPTPDRWEVWPRAKHANELIKREAERTRDFVFLDFTSDFLLPEGNPNPDLFKMDGLHLNDKGYAIWTARLKPILAEK